ncbi:hypothetical protein DEU56DRAFT_912052 [Suillus clintonianus]|uniref:uncharacterized protein n=1 Tax=Suillus clintonianus TaxID=1904413 RepID=UPI001B87FB2D|nr:uncharacterized protein DEU56DRAFT_912052 [Suillus clintonianus]KAG2139786.1 hypothetical protein DEU56DRAFT_912052 [Suillus clintonianus]
MALAKIAKVILSHPEIACILFILILERSKYKSPTADSATYGEALADKSVRPYTFFAPEREPDKLFGPVHVMDHTWINVSKIEYFVWIKPDDRPIDIKSPHTAYGTMFPDLNMDQVSNTLNTGFNKVRAEMASTLDLMEPDVDHAHLLSTGQPTSGTAPGTVANSLAQNIVVKTVALAQRDLQPDRRSHLRLMKGDPQPVHRPVLWPVRRAALQGALQGALRVVLWVG